MQLIQPIIGDISITIGGVITQAVNRPDSHTAWHRLATHSQFLIAAYVIDTQHEKNEFDHWLMLNQACAHIQEVLPGRKERNSKCILEAILYGK